MPSSRRLPQTSSPKDKPSRPRRLNPEQLAALASYRSLTQKWVQKMCEPDDTSLDQLFDVHRQMADLAVQHPWLMEFDA